MEKKKKKIRKGRSEGGGTEEERKRKGDKSNKNMKNLDMLSSRCPLDIHLEMLTRQVDRYKYKKLRTICVHKVHKAMILEGIPRDRGLLMKSKD